MSDAGFVLAKTLADDTHVVGDLPVARVLLMDDARFPWLILVPRIGGMRDLIDLSREQQHTLLDEIDHCAHVLRELHAPLKLNIASLGNLVAQLHVHVIARYATDAAWPRPVWGVGERQTYAVAARDAELGRLRSALGLAAPR